VRALFGWRWLFSHDYSFARTRRFLCARRQELRTDFFVAFGDVNR
jgi:hypothetical protein